MINENKKPYATLIDFTKAFDVNELEEILVSNEFKGIEIGKLKLFLLLGDDIIFFSESPDGLQRGLDILKD